MIRFPLSPQISLISQKIRELKGYKIAYPRSIEE